MSSDKGGGESQPAQDAQMSDAEVRQLTEKTNRFLERFGTLQVSTLEPATEGDFGKVFNLIRAFSVEHGAQLPLTAPAQQIEIADEVLSRYLVMCGENLDDIPGEIKKLIGYLTHLQTAYEKVTNDSSRIAAAVNKAGGDWDAVQEKFDPEYKALKERLKLCTDTYQKKGVNIEKRRVHKNFKTRVTQWCARNGVTLKKKKTRHNPRKKSR